MKPADRKDSKAHSFYPHYFTERPYRWVPEDEVFKNHAFFAVPNKYFDRDYAKELDLPDPYECTPGAVKVHAGAKRVPVVDREPLASLGLV